MAKDFNSGAVVQSEEIYERNEYKNGL